MPDTCYNNINISINPHIISAGYRFIKVDRRDKKATERGWNKTANYSHDASELTTWIADGGNYGVLGSSERIVIDTDNEILVALLDQLPETFTVRSGSGRGNHVYFRCANATNLILVNPDNPSDNWGNVQAAGKFVVGPGSVHPSGGTYDIIKDVPVATITTDDIERVFGQYIKRKREVTRDDVRHEYGLYSDIFDTVSLAEVGCYPVSPIDHGNGEIQGAHPIHGSTGGMNFSINTRKNLWHCYREDSGGGPLEWLAVSEGIIDCSEAGPGCLRGDKFIQVLEIAKQKGIKIDLPKKLPPRRPRILPGDRYNDRRPPAPPTDSPQPEIPPQVLSDEERARLLSEWGSDDSESEPHNPPPRTEKSIVASSHADAACDGSLESKISTVTALPEAIPDADVVLIDAPPRVGKTHRIIVWAATQCKTANVITTSHSIVGQQLRIFNENKNSISTAVHLEGKERCCLKKEKNVSCKLCEYYPFDGENYLDIKQHCKDLLQDKKVLTKENCNETRMSRYCPYYILKQAEPFADYCFTVVANMDRLTKRDYTFIDEDPSIAHFFASSVELFEAAFHASSVSASSKLEEKWPGIEKYKKYLSDHRHKGKKVLLRVIEILEQFRAVLTVESMSRETKSSLIDQLSQIDTALPELTDCLPHELLDHVKKFESPDSFSPFVEALLFQYTPQKFLWTGSNPSTLHLVADGDTLMRPAPENKLVVIGSTRAELFVRAVNRDYKVLRMPAFPYSNWFSLLVLREGDSKDNKRAMEGILKKLSHTNEKHRYPLLVLTGSEKHQKRLKTILGGIAHCSSDENQIGQLWNKRSGMINIFYQNSVISRGIDVDFYNMLFVYSSDFANPYWAARLQVAKDTRNIEDGEFAQSILDAITVDETTNSVLRISPVRTTQDSLPRVIVISDSDLWKIKVPVVEGAVRIPVDAEFFDNRGWGEVLEKRKLGLYDVWQDPEMSCNEIHELRAPDMESFEKLIRGTDISFVSWQDDYSAAQIQDIYEEIRKYLKGKQKRGWRASEKATINYILNKVSKKKAYITENTIRNGIRDLVILGEVVREGGMGDTSMISLRERYVAPEIGDSGQFDV